MIEAISLSMRYGAFTALNRVSFQANKGEILGLLGPNGAGKTTLMRVLTTYLYPSEGTARVAGFDILTDPLEVRRRLGYLPEQVPLYTEMRVDEYLTFVGRARGLEGNALEPRLKWVRDACDLVPVWKHAVSELSKGYRQRVGLAQSLIHDPQVLIFDEPTSGLDPLQIIGIRGLVRSLAREKTIVFSTHILQEVEALADRIVIINEGRIVADGTREDIAKRALKTQRVKLVVGGAKDEVEGALKTLGVADEIHYRGSAGDGMNRFFIRSASGRPVLQMLDELVKEKHWPLRELAEEEADLEEAFISLLKPRPDGGGS